jgi:hypothetical protein
MARYWVIIGVAISSAGAGRLDPSAEVVSFTAAIGVPGKPADLIMKPVLAGLGI